MVVPCLHVLYNSIIINMLYGLFEYFLSLA